MANGLAEDGHLSATDQRKWRNLNDRANAIYPDPERHTPGTMTPGARSVDGVFRPRAPQRAGQGRPIPRSELRSRTVRPVRCHPRAIQLVPG